MKLSIIIPVYNEEKYISACLKSIFNQITPPDEIILVDNNCTDETIKIVKNFPPIRIIEEKKQGMIPARNAGFNAAKGDILARIDADTRLPKNWVKRVKKRFANDPLLVAYSGPTIFEDKRFNKILAYPEKMFIASFRKIIGGDLLYGPNMIIRNSAWKKIRSFVCSTDKIVHEDLDIAIHLHQLAIGKVVFDTKFTVTASERRWKKIIPYIEYPYRYLRTLQHHKQSFHALKTKTAMVGKALPRPRKLLKKIRSSADASMKFAKTLTS